MLHYNQLLVIKPLNHKRSCRLYYYSLMLSIVIMIIIIMKFNMINDINRLENGETRRFCLENNNNKKTFRVFFLGGNGLGKLFENC